MNAWWILWTVRGFRGSLRKTSKKVWGFFEVEGRLKYLRFILKKPQKASKFEVRMRVAVFGLRFKLWGKLEPIILRFFEDKPQKTSKFEARMRLAFLRFFTSLMPILLISSLITKAEYFDFSMSYTLFQHFIQIFKIVKMINLSLWCKQEVKK